MFTLILAGWVYQAACNAAAAMISVPLSSRFASIMFPLAFAFLFANFNIIESAGITPLLLALFLSLIIQEFLTRYVLFPEENQALSRRLGVNDRLVSISGMTSPLITSAGVFLTPFILSTSILLVVTYTTPGLLSLSGWAWVVLSLTLGLLLDPLTAVVFETDFSQAATACLGYLSIILVAIGAIPVASDGLVFQLLLCLALLNVRITFMLEFAYKQHQDMTSFAPAVIALFIAVLPNLAVIVERL